jgi:hypothetical protein
VSIVRAPRSEKGWVAIPNATIRDRRLSWKDRGILAFILSLPDDAETTIAKLTEAGPDGTDSTRAALKRLAECGYVKRVKARRPDGTWSTLTYVYDTPEAAKQASLDQMSLDITAGQHQEGKPGLDEPTKHVPAGQIQDGFTNVDDPTRVTRVGKHPSKEQRPWGEDQTTNEPAVLGSAGALLAKALVGGLPKQLKTRTPAGSLTRRCSELAADGWTVDAIATWTAEQDWGGARSGALVSARLRDLGAPPQAKPAALGCTACISGWLPDDHHNDLPGTFPCPTCRPEIARRLKEAR